MNSDGLRATVDDQPGKWKEDRHVILRACTADVSSEARAG